MAAPAAAAAAAAGSAGAGRSVLVTGASGLIGGRIAAELCAAGWKVKAAVRDADPESEYAKTRLGHLRAAAAKAGDQGGMDYITVADLSDKAALEKAVVGCSHVMHVASPIAIGGSLSDDDVKTAVDGTRFMMEAAAAAGVQRIVVTSSMAALCGNQVEEDPKHVWTEADTNTEPASNYSKSKALACQEAERLAKELPKLELVTLHPALAMGANLEGQLAASTNAMILSLVDGSAKKAGGLPPAAFGVIDVKDVSAAHIAALTAPEAAGQRYIVSSRDQFTTGELAAMAREAFPHLADDIPTNYVDDAKVAPPRKPTADNRKVCALLGVEDLRSVSDTLKEAVESFIADGQVRAK